MVGRSSVSSYEPPADGWRTFLIVWVTQPISVSGSALTGFAVNIWLTVVRFPSAAQKSELAAALAAVDLAWTIPTVFGAPLAGVWGDRHDRRRTMMAVDCLSAVLSLALAALVLANALGVWLVVLLLALFALRSV